jgi:1,4-alpha-glucan branching enzyme
MPAKSKKKLEATKKSREARFSLLAPQAKSVFLAGDFNEWNTSSHLLSQDKKGTWKISLSLNPGQYQYRFIVDGEWQNDPDCDSFVENPFGESNCLKIVE